MRLRLAFAFTLAGIHVATGTAVARGNKGAVPGQPGPVHLQRVWEPREQAFTVLVQIVDKKRQTHAEIRHDSWLFLTGQEDYVNPHTGLVEQGSNQYKRRWINGSGDVIYTDDPNYDPRADPNLQGRTSDFQQSRVRQR